MEKMQNSFTLIELIVVVVIIGILAAIAIPQYQEYVARAQVSQALVLASGAKIAVAEYANTNGTYPADSAEAGLSAMTGTYVASVEVLAGTITATFDSTTNGAHSAIARKTMTLTPAPVEADLATSGSISWTCGGTVDTKYLPSSCH